LTQSLSHPAGFPDGLAAAGKFQGKLDEIDGFSWVVAVELDDIDRFSRVTVPDLPVLPRNGRERRLSANLYKVCSVQPLQCLDEIHGQ
jgi:hypothetical protein